MLTRWKPFDPLVAIAIGVNILWSGRRGIAKSSKSIFIFPRATPVGEAHRLATALEERSLANFGKPAEVVTHLESLEDHEDVHSTEHYTRHPR